MSNFLPGKTQRAAQRINLFILAGFLLFPACEPSDKIADRSSPRNGDIETDANQPNSAEVANAANDERQEEILAFSSDGQWPLFRGNSQSTGVAVSDLPDKLSVLWKYEIPKGAFEGSPIVVGDADQQAVYIGDADGKLLALNLENGELLWSVKTEWGFVTAPAFHNGRIYVGDMDGVFYCFEKNGDEKWRFQADDSIDSSANFYQDMVLFGSRDSRLYALNAESGIEQWRMETGDQVRCSITVVDGHAFVAGCDGALHVIDLEKSEEVNSIAIQSPTGVTPAAVNDAIFVGTEQSDFFAIDWKKGEINWQYNDDEGSISTRSSPTVTEDHVVFGARNRKIYSVNPITGKLNWSKELKANIDASPVIVGDRLFAADSGGRLYEMNLENGEVTWQKEFNGGFISSPAVGFGRLIVATDRGVVYCLGSGSALATNLNRPASSKANDD